MRSSLLWLVPVALVCTQAVAVGDWNVEKETRTLKMTASAGQPLTVHTRNGGVTVVQGTADEVVITAEVYAKNKEDLSKVQIEAANDAAKGSSVHVKFPDGKRSDVMGCSLRIEMPRAKGVTIETSNGPIVLEQMAGKAVLETSNGPVTVTKHDGSVAIETDNAPVEASDVTGAVAIETSNGPVEVNLHESATEKFVIETSNAPVTVTVPSSFNGILGVETSNGNIAFPSDSEITKKPSSRGYGDVSGQATFGKGGPVCTIETSNGPVQIRYRGAKGDAVKPQKKPSTH
jgi:DUF4097 and DUF4098 domain-containing protein YvlB